MGSPTNQTLDFAVMASIFQKGKKRITICKNLCVKPDCTLAWELRGPVGISDDAKAMCLTLPKHFQSIAAVADHMWGLIQNMAPKAQTQTEAPNFL